MKSDINILDPQMPGLLQQATPTTKLGLTHLPLTNPRAYYRSKIFSVQTGSNPLVVAAACLLTTSASLRTLPHLTNTRTLYQDLIHEIKAFETQAQTQGYRAELIMVSRYILCATLDEIILSTSWGLEGGWAKHKLLPKFHNEEWGGERFFFILERLHADVALHIDVLELIYLCLGLGFTGKYQLIENGTVQLNDITENLYQTIRWQRGDIKKELLIQQKETEKQLTTKHEPLPFWLLITFIITVLLTLLFMFDFMLGSSTQHLSQQLTELLVLTDMS